MPPPLFVKSDDIAFMTIEIISHISLAGERPFRKARCLGLCLLASIMRVALISFQVWRIALGLSCAGKVKSSYPLLDSSFRFGV